MNKGTNTPIRGWVALIGFFLISITMLEAQLTNTPPVIKAIEVQYVGPQNVSEQRIRGYLSMRVGDAYASALAEQDVKSLYDSGEIDNVRILTEPSGEGVKVIVLVQTRSSLSELFFLGNSTYSNKRLAREVDVKVGEPIDETRLLEGQQSIEELYLEKGFSDISVTYQTEETGEDGFARVTFQIDEGSKTLLRNVTFNGNTVFTNKELVKEMGVKKKNLWSVFSRKTKLDNDQLEKDLETIEGLYQNNGYLNAKVVDVERIPVSGDKVDLNITLEEGQVYNIGVVRLEGIQIFPASDLQPILLLRGGEVYSAASIREDQRGLRDYYGSRGYADTNVTPRIEEGGPNVVNVIYDVFEGDKSFIKRINISGNTKTQDKVIRRELAVSPGEEFNTVNLRASQARLQNTGYFSAVEVVPTDSDTAGFKDIDLDVTEKSTGTVNFGAGFSSIDSLVGFVDVTQTNFDIKNWPRFTGGGQKFRFSLKGGTERRDFIVSLTEPWFMDQRLALGGELYYRENFYLSDDYSERRYGGAVHLRKPFGEYGYLRLEYRPEMIEIYDIARDASEEIQAEEGSFFRNGLKADYVHDTRDSLFLTRKGHRYSVGLGTALGGDVSNVSLSAEAIKFWSLPFDLIFSLQGAIRTVDGDAPIFEREFLGGANDLRGFDFRDVGPKDEFGEPLGGQTSVYGTAELTFPIVSKVRGAVFYDTGIVSKGSFDLGGDVNSNVGIGLRLFLPIGPIRLDFGIPVQSDRFNDSGGKFNFNIGYQF